MATTMADPEPPSVSENARAKLVSLCADRGADLLGELVKRLTDQAG
jgi:hypothetical protein